VRIDPNKIAEWKATAEDAPPDPVREEYMPDEREGGAERPVLFRDEAAERFYAAARAAVPALLAEREESEEMLRSADRALAWCLRRDPLAAPAASWRLRYAALMGRTAPEQHYEPLAREEWPAKVDALLALLRDVEWGGAGAQREGAHICPSCGAYAGLKHEPVRGRHSADCRLAALLRSA